MSKDIPGGIGKGRIEALADGVFAIALTLLILDIKVPALAPGEGGDDLLRKLLGSRQHPKHCGTAAATWPDFSSRQTR